LFLAASVFYAIKDAIIEARKEHGISAPFRLDSPATAERIRLACEDDITKKVILNKCFHYIFFVWIYNMRVNIFIIAVYHMFI